MGEIRGPLRHHARPLDQRELVAQGAVRCIVAPCTIGNTGPLAQAICAQNLYFLSSNQDTVASIVQDGGVRVISFLATELHNQRVQMDFVP